MAKVFKKGNLVIVTVTGKVAKKENGRATGEWISFSNGDVGAIVDVKKRRGRQPVLSVKLDDGTVDLLPQNVDVLREVGDEVDI